MRTSRVTQLAVLRVYVEKHNLSLKGVRGTESAVEGIQISEMEEEQVNLVKKAAGRDKFKFKTIVSMISIFWTADTDWGLAVPTREGTYR